MLVSTVMAEEGVMDDVNKGDLDDVNKGDLQTLQGQSGCSSK